MYNVSGFVNSPSCFLQTLQCTNNYCFAFIAVVGSDSNSPFLSVAAFSNASHFLRLTASLFPHASSTACSVGDSDVRRDISACSPAAPSGSSPVSSGDLLMSSCPRLHITSLALHHFVCCRVCIYA